MPFDTTVGGASANSYAEVAFADDYVARTSYAVKWALKSGPEKEVLLQRAALELDKLSFHGVPVSATQALQWPRYYVERPAGGEYEGTELPLALKQAQSLLAGWLSNTTEADPFGGDDTSKLSSLSVGPISMDFRQGGSNPGPSFIAQAVYTLLYNGGLTGAPGAGRLTR